MQNWCTNGTLCRVCLWSLHTWMSPGTLLVNDDCHVMPMRKVQSFESMNFPRSGGTILYCSTAPPSQHVQCTKHRSCTSFACLHVRVNRQTATVHVSHSGRREGRQADRQESEHIRIVPESQVNILALCRYLVCRLPVSRGALPPSI